MLIHVNPQSSKRSGRSGRLRRRKRRLHERPRKSDSASRSSSSAVRTTHQTNPCTDNTCEHPLDLLRPWVDHSCLRSVMRQMLEANLSLNIRSRLRRWREWHSTPLRTSCTAASITMGTVTRSRRMGRTTRCTHNVIPPLPERSSIYSWPGSVEATRVMRVTTASSVRWLRRYLAPSLFHSKDEILTMETEDNGQTFHQ